MSGPIVPAPTQFPPGLTASALDLIKSAMRMIHVLSAGEEPPGDEANDALKYLNQMIDGWNAEQLMIVKTLIQDFAIDGTKQTYTYGVGGDFDATRPSSINGVSIILLTNPSQPLERPISYLTEEEWRENYPIKNVPSTFPLAVYDDQNFPLRNLTFWPAGTDANSCRIYSWDPLQQFNDLKATYGWAPGYIEAIKYNLALVLADEWGGELGQTIVAGAVGSKARIKVSNVSIDTLKCDDALTRGTGAANYKAGFFGIPTL